MRRLPAKIVRILEEAPRRCPRRAHIMGMVQWRLERGLSFTSQDLVKAARFRTTKRFVESNLDSLIMQGVLMQGPDKAYAASERNKSGCEAALRKYAEENPHFSRRDVWLGMPSSMKENELDRLLRRMVEAGEIKKIGRGAYMSSSAEYLEEPVKIKPRKKPAASGKKEAAGLYVVAKAA